MTTTHHAALGGSQCSMHAGGPRGDNNTSRSSGWFTVSHARRRSGTGTSQSLRHVRMCCVNATVQVRQREHAVTLGPVSPHVCCRTGCCPAALPQLAAGTAVVPRMQCLMCHVRVCDGHALRAAFMARRPATAVGRDAKERVCGSFVALPGSVVELSTVSRCCQFTERRNKNIRGVGISPSGSDSDA